MPGRADIRSEMRNWRRNLPDGVREQASVLMSEIVAGSTSFRNARRIAAYIAFDGEIDPAPLVDAAIESGKSVYLPVVGMAGHLRFANYGPDTMMSLNRYGIPEPSAARRSFVSAKLLDLVLLPLVAFDLNGNRLGMGAGYYDRCFSYLKHRQHWFRPSLMGLAFESQRVEKLESESWDIPLHRIATERGIYSVRNARPGIGTKVSSSK